MKEHFIIYENNESIVLFVDHFYKEYEIIRDPVSIEFINKFNYPFSITCKQYSLLLSNLYDCRYREVKEK